MPCMPRSIVVPEPRSWAHLDPFLHYDPDHTTLEAGGFQSLGGAAWRSLKREREEVTSSAPTLFGESNLFRNLDFMRSSNLLARDNCVRNMDLHTYDNVASMDIGTYRDPTFQTPPPPILPSTAPSKKTRFALTSEDLHMSYSRGFWGGSQLEAGFTPVRDDLPLTYRRLTSTDSSDVRMRSPPALIPLPQQQPVRPQPLSPLRPPGLPASMEWDHVSLPCLAYSLLHTRTYTRTLPPPQIGLSRVAPLLHPSVP